VHRVAPGNDQVLLEWQRGITRAAEAFPGYQATEVYPPAADRPLDWVIVIHFDNPKSLQDWLDSSQRAAWTAKLPPGIREFHLKTLPSGFSAWFAGLADEGARLPHWKVFLLVLFGLYPTVMLLTLFLAPHTQRFGLAVSILLGNVASCAILEWLGSPVIRLLLGPWLRATGKEGRARNVIGTILIVASLAAMACVFYLLTK
jgi:antibiotic biosynthesis monooxygenase (ABM) superfamily enzyme